MALTFQVPLQSLPKFMGRIQACVGLGFVLGPATMTVLQRVFRVSTADTFFAAAIFPLVGVVYAIFRVSETKPGDSGISQLWRGSVQARLPPTSSASSKSRSSNAPTPSRGTQVAGRPDPQDSRLLEDDEADAFGGEDALAWEDTDEAFDGSSLDDAALTSDGSGVAEQLIPRAVLLLVGNGFLLMYAFSIETIYAMFLKVWWLLSFSVSPLFPRNASIAQILCFSLAEYNHSVARLRIKEYPE